MFVLSRGVGPLLGVDMLLGLVESPPQIEGLTLGLFARSNRLLGS